jgi:hypothetical protein
MMRMLSEVSGEIADKLRTCPGGTVIIIDEGTTIFVKKMCMYAHEQQE